VPFGHSFLLIAIEDRKYKLPLTLLYTTGVGSIWHLTRSCDLQSKNAHKKNIRMNVFGI
jgi:hypothetical protein